MSSVLEKVAMLTVNRQAQRPYRGTNEHGQITYRICSVVCSGKIYVGQAAMAAIESGNLAGAQLQAGIDFQEVDNYQLSMLVLGQEEPERYLDELSKNTPVLGDQVYYALGLLQRGAKVKAVLHDGWRIGDNRMVPTTAIQELTVISLGGGAEPEGARLWRAGSAPTGKA